MGKQALFSRKPTGQLGDLVMASGQRPSPNHHLPSLIPNLIPHLTSIGDAFQARFGCTENARWRLAGTGVIGPGGPVVVFIRFAVDFIAEVGHFEGATVFESALPGQDADR